jgi:hypothetical protein
VILDCEGREVFQRACPGEPQARAFASTVEQHRGWLSEDRFRRYYRLPEEAWVGFNARQPGKVKKGDILFLVSGVVLIVAAFIAVFVAIR